MYLSDEGEFGKGTCLRLFSFYLSIIAPFVALVEKKWRKPFVPFDQNGSTRLYLLFFEERSFRKKKTLLIGMSSLKKEKNSRLNFALKSTDPLKNSSLIHLMLLCRPKIN